MQTIYTIMGVLLASSFFILAGIIVLEAKDDKPEQKRIYKPYHPQPYPEVSAEQKN